MINVQNESKSTSQPIPTLPLVSSSDVGFGILSYGDDAWSIQYRGKQTELARSDEGGRATSIEVIIVKASNTLCGDGQKNLELA